MVTPWINTFVSRTVVDFSSKEDYVVKQMRLVTAKKGWIGLSKTEVTMLDSIIDPFGTATDNMSFLNVEELNLYDLDRDDEGMP